MRIRILIVPALLMSFAAVFAEDAPKRDEAPALQTAVFALPDAGDEAVVRQLTKALAKHAGLVAAKADSEAEQFLVTFETGKTDAEALTAIVVEVAPDAKLESVKAAAKEAPAHDCGKCPSRSTCGKAKEDHAKSPS